MKVTYLKLENVAGINVAQNRNVIEIDFSLSQHRIISIQGDNGKGKTTLLSSIHPFASVTSLDERSSIPYITPGKSGYKEIHYLHDGARYVIKHYFKATKDTHSVRSYFQRDGEELNENGNVGTFLTLVELHFGLTPEMMRLVRLGSNVNSFVTLRPAERKSYVGRLIEEIELYLKIHRKINDDLRLVKMMIGTNGANLQKCHILDVTVEGEQLIKLAARVRQNEKERDAIRLRISKIEALENENNVVELHRKRQEAEASLFTFQQTDEEIKRLGLENVKVETLIQEHTKLVDVEVGYRSRLSSLRLMIDTNLKRIESLETNVRKITSNADIDSLTGLITELRALVNGTEKWVTEFPINGCRSEDVTMMITRLGAFNQISTMIHTFGVKSVSTFLRLRREGRSVEAYVQEQAKRRLSTVSDAELKKLLSQVFQDDYIITPNCDYEFNDCPYYRFSTVVNEYRSRAFDDLQDEDVLRYLRVIATNVDAMLNEIERLVHLPVPDRFKGIMLETNFLARLENKLSFFDLSDLQDYLTGLRSAEIYRDQVAKLHQLEHELQVYRSNGAGQQLSEIEQLRVAIDGYRSDIAIVDKELLSHREKIRQVESTIGLLTSYNDGKKYRDIVQGTLDATNRILKPLESAADEKVELRYKLDSAEGAVNVSKSEHRQLEQRLEQYHQLVEEGKRLSATYDKLNVIMTSVSTKKGIPLVYMNTYLGRIQTLTNSLLSIIYDGELTVDRFNVTADEFEIPFTRNGSRIPDIRYASQSEVALITMALSFALAHAANQNYNILLLDEIDAGLDEKNRLAFLKMFERQMVELKGEQAFIISHNINQMLNLPMDVIKLSETGIKSKLQNVIFE